jgi:hypothetical protein
MTTRRKPTPFDRPRAERPTTISLNRRTLHEWYAEYKARKAAAAGPRAGGGGNA